MKESSSVARSVGTKTVSNQMHVADLTSRPYHHVNNETELSPNHPGVWHRLVVIWRRGSLSPCHDDDIEIILPKISKVNDYKKTTYFTLFQVTFSASSWDQEEFMARAIFFRACFFLLYNINVLSQLYLKQHFIVKHWEEFCSPLSTRHSSFRITMSTL